MMALWTASSESLSMMRFLDISVRTVRGTVLVTTAHEGKIEPLTPNLKRVSTMVHVLVRVNSHDAPSLHRVQQSAEATTTCGVSRAHNSTLRTFAKAASQIMAMPGTTMPAKTTSVGISNNATLIAKHFAIVRMINTVRSWLHA